MLEADPWLEEECIEQYAGAAERLQLLRSRGAEAQVLVVALQVASHGSFMMFLMFFSHFRSFGVVIIMLIILQHDYHLVVPLVFTTRASGDLRRGRNTAGTQA